MLEFYLYKRRMKKKGYTVYDVDKNVINVFRITTRKNKYLSDFEIKKKLNRDIACSHLISINDGNKIYTYGAMNIIISKNRIIGVANGIYHRKNIDKSIKEKMTKIFEVK